MGNIPVAPVNPLTTAVPGFSNRLQQARERDINESDTVTVVRDIPEQISAFDKYSEITREHAIHGTCSKLAITWGKGIDYLIEQKAIKRSPKDTQPEASGQPCIA